VKYGLCFRRPFENREGGKKQTPSPLFKPIFRAVYKSDFSFQRVCVSLVPYIDFRNISQLPPTARWERERCRRCCCLVATADGGKSVFHCFVIRPLARHRTKNNVWQQSVFSTTFDSRSKRIPRLFTVFI